MEVVLTSHGDFCHGIMSSYQMIAGENKNFHAISLTEAGIQDYSNRLKEVLTEFETEEVLILTDIKGGTPYNEAFQYYLSNEERVRVVAGMNLPMVIETGLNLANSSLTELSKNAIEVGRIGIEGADSDAAQENDLEF